METFVIVLERSTTGYGAYSPDILGCVATGKTVEETLEQMRSALVFHFEAMLMAGEPLPEPKPNGIEDFLRSREWGFDPGDLITTFPAEELLAQVSVEATAH